MLYVTYCVLCLTVLMNVAKSFLILPHPLRHEPIISKGLILS